LLDEAQKLDDFPHRRKVFSQKGRGRVAAKASIEEIVLPEIHLLRPKRDSLREMANEVCTEVLGPGWNKKRGRYR
jgi:hypothetical protein